MDETVGADETVDSVGSEETFGVDETSEDITSSDVGGGSCEDVPGADEIAELPVTSGVDTVMETEEAFEKDDVDTGIHEQPADNIVSIKMIA